MSLHTLRQQSAKIRYLESLLHDHMALYGYEHISLPYIEPSDIFLTRAGDKIIDRLFTFDRFGHQLALRPEFTAAAAYFYVQSKKTDVARWQFSGAIFEDEPDDPSLNYQKHSIGAECIGLNGIKTDVDTIAMAIEGVSKLGIKDWKLVIGHVGLQLQLLSRFNLDSRTYRILLSQRNILKSQGKDTALDNLQQLIKTENADETVTNSRESSRQTQHILDVLLDSTRYGTTMGGRTRHDIAQRLLNKSERTLEASQLRAALDFFADWVNLRAPVDEAFAQIQHWIGDDVAGQAILTDWQQSIELLKVCGINREQIIIQADLTKNWEYYTGIVFGVEVEADVYIVGGGRYDELTRILGSTQNIPAIGFAYYVDDILPLLDSPAVNQPIVTIKGQDTNNVIKWAQFLRENGIPVIFDSPDENNTQITLENDRACLQDVTYTFAQRNELLKELRSNQ